MKLYRILTYAAIGVIAGLFIENRILDCEIEKAKRKLEKKKSREGLAEQSI